MEPVSQGGEEDDVMRAHSHNVVQMVPIRSNFDNNSQLASDPNLAYSNGRNGTLKDKLKFDNFLDSGSSPVRRP